MRVKCESRSSYGNLVWNLNSLLYAFAELLFVQCSLYSSMSQLSVALLFETPAVAADYIFFKLILLKTGKEYLFFLFELFQFFLPDIGYDAIELQFADVMTQVELLGMNSNCMKSDSVSYYTAAANDQNLEYF